MHKFLIFDADDSLSTLGNHDQIREMTGGITPIRIMAGVKQIKSRIDKLFTAVEVDVKHELFDEPIKEIRYQPTKLCTDIGLTGIVVDTMSHTFRQDMRILERANKSGALEMADWGKLERMYNEFVSMLRNLPIWIVVNCHIAYDKDQASGTFYYTPQLKGSTKDSVQEYFDVILYTKASRDGKKLYTWQTFSDASRWGKDRKNVLAPFINQDFSTVLKSYILAGIDTPKLLIIGESGTGKSKALSTINKE
jgi:hypothetical protein